MSTTYTIVCDICGAEMAKYNELRPPEQTWESDGGIWFHGGTLGIPHVCKECRRNVTLQNAYERAKKRIESEVAARPRTPQDERQDDHDKVKRKS